MKWFYCYIQILQSPHIHSVVLIKGNSIVGTALSGCQRLTVCWLNVYNAAWKRIALWVFSAYWSTFHCFSVHSPSITTRGFRQILYNYSRRQMCVLINNKLIIPSLRNWLEAKRLWFYCNYLFCFKDILYLCFRNISSIYVLFFSLICLVWLST